MSPALLSAPRSRPHRLAAPLIHLLLILGLCSGTPLAQGAIPIYFQQAIAGFTPEVPAGWAYTVTTKQEERETTERFDPARPPTAQWTLLRVGERAPTEKEIVQYMKYKAGHAPGATRATYTKNDIEPFSFKLVQEDEHRAVFTASFREQAANADKMLAHLQLRLVVSKQPAYIEKASLELTGPYSPVLTVKMNELVASMEFSPLTTTRPSLPTRSSSHFRGRIFFFSVEENLDLTYTDFAPSP